MFLKVKIVMAEFSNPGIILMPQIHAGKMCNISKIVENFSHTYLCLTHDWLHSLEGSRGKSRKCKTKTKPGRIINKKKMFLVQTSHLHYMS